MNSLLPSIARLLLPVLLIMAAPAIAQMVDANGKTIHVFQVDEAPVLDGVLDDDAWAFATIVEDLHEVNPEEFGEPSEKSRIYVVITKDALYVAGKFWDSEPDKVGAQVLRQGDFSFGEDSFTVIVDPFNNGRSGYAFDLTANSVRNQAVYTNVVYENWEWRGIWHGKSRLDDEGWVAEIEIPFKTLSFDPNNETWGLNFARYIGRKSEQIGWVSANRKQNPANSGKMVGLSGADQGVGLDVVPGARTGQKKNYLTGETRSETEPTLDLFYKLTPGLTGSLTFNTDFSGTGADARQINLTRFGLFFPEQRSFFLQDADIFEFGLITGGDYSSGSTLQRVELESGRPFFSRRIGLSENGEPVDIVAGGKLTGRVGGVDIGMLGIRQSAYLTGDIDDPSVGVREVDAADLFVVRLAANVLTESSVGMILTHGDPTSNLDNSVAGVDFRYLNTRMGNGGTVEGSMWYQQSDTEGIEGSDAAFGVTLRAPNAIGYRALIGFKEIQENFNPALGFVNRHGVRDTALEFGYTWYPQASAFRSIYSGVDFQHIETTEGELQSQILTLRPFEFGNDYGDYFSLHYNIVEEQLVDEFEISDGVIIPAGNYQFNDYCLNFSTGEYRRVAGEAYYCGGEFFDGTEDAAGGAVIWRPSPHFKFTGRYDYFHAVLPYGSFITRLASVRADIAFTNTWYWENLLQYDNVSYSMGLNSILRWVPLAGREVILVVNREFVDFTRDRTFTTVSGDITFKFTYTFRF